MNRLLLTVFAVTLLLSLLAPSDKCLAVDTNALTIRGDQLDQSINSYTNDELGPLAVVIKAWNDTYDARSRFDISFYSSVPEFHNARSAFLQTIRIYDGNKDIQVHDWDSAECSLEKIVLVRKQASIYLVVANRSSTDKSTEIIPQNAPAPQTLRLFQLTEVGKASLQQGHGKSRVFFQKVTEHKTTDELCSADEVYRAMQTFADETVK